jgi:hypothetical protein
MLSRIVARYLRWCGVVLGFFRRGATVRRATDSGEPLDCRTSALFISTRACWRPPRVAQPKLSAAKYFSFSSDAAFWFFFSKKSPKCDVLQAEDAMNEPPAPSVPRKARTGECRSRHPPSPSAPTARSRRNDPSCKRTNKKSAFFPKACWENRVHFVFPREACFLDSTKKARVCPAASLPRVRWGRSVCGIPFSSSDALVSTGLIGGGVALAAHFRGCLVFPTQIKNPKPQPKWGEKCEKIKVWNKTGTCRELTDVLPPHSPLVLPRSTASAEARGPELEQGREGQRQGVAQDREAALQARRRAQADVGEGAGGGGGAGGGAIQVDP